MRSPDDLIKKLQNAPITPKAEVEELLYTWDWRAFVTPNLTERNLQNHSFYHSFFVKKENGSALLRAKKYPQSPEWIPAGGIKLLSDNIQFEAVGASDFRIESLHFDRVFSDLYTKYFPTLERKDRIEAEASWEKLRTVIENLPKKQENLPPMRILALPRQLPVLPSILPHYLDQFMNEDTPELLGHNCLVEPTESQFQTEIRPGMDIAVYTRSKRDRPWLGRVLNVHENGETFEVQWFKKRGRSGTFQALTNPDGTRYTSVLASDTVMLWEFSDCKTVDSFDVTKEWLDKINKEYISHDMCYV